MAYKRNNGVLGALWNKATVQLDVFKMEILSIATEKMYEISCTAKLSQRFQ